MLSEISHRESKISPGRGLSDNQTGAKEYEFTSTVKNIQATIMLPQHTPQSDLFPH
jgi:hypothetical protein